MNEKVINCACCDKLFARKHSKQKYCCQKCREKMKIEKQKLYFQTYYRDRTKPYKYKPKKKDGETMEQLEADAMKFGTSYGKYVAMTECGMAIERRGEEDES